MGPSLGDTALVEHDDLVGVANRRQAMRDRDDGAAARKPLERGLNRPLGLRIERRGASSSTRIGGLRRIVRAIAMRCFSPPEKRYPRSPTTVSYPSGSPAMSSWICAARAASSISSSVASGVANRRFSRTVAWKRYVSCETTPTAFASEGNVSRSRRRRR